MDGFDAIYLLSEDRERIHLIQNAVLQTEEFGIAMEHGIFGSHEWWAAIRRSGLPVHTAQEAHHRKVLVVESLPAGRMTPPRASPQSLHSFLCIL